MWETVVDYSAYPALLLKFLITLLFVNSVLAEYGREGIYLLYKLTIISVIRNVHFLFLIWIPCSFLSLDFILGDKSELLM